jgi:uncharacterized phage protein (TIGR01671 family)
VREIKFRAWDSKNKLMLNPDENNDNNLCVPCCDYNYDYAEYLQYTGLKDCDGIEIYEGDIIKFFYNENKVYKKIIKFECGMFITTFDGISGNSLYSTCTRVNHPKMYIIGNIYENPELLLEK